MNGKLLRVEPDGTKVIQKNNKIFRIAPATNDRPSSYYWPFCGRRAFLAGRKDHRETPEFAEFVRADRQIGLCGTKAIHPGPQ